MTEGESQEGQETPAACSRPLCGVQGSRPLCGVQGAFGAFKAGERRSRRLWGVQGRGEGFKVQGACGAFKAAARRSKFKVQGCFAGFKLGHF